MRILLIIILLVLIELYFYKKLKKSLLGIFPSVVLSKLRRIVLIIYSFANLYPLIILAYWINNLINGGRGRMPESVLSDIITILFWVPLLIMLQAALFFIITDVLKLFILPLYKRYKTKILAWEARLLFVIITFCVLYVPARIIYDFNAVEINTTGLVKKNLPLQLDNLKIVFISDIQADRYTGRDRLQNYISKVNALNPDLVLIAGDIITGTPDYISLAAEYVGKIKSKYGVYSCVGDHDNWAYREDTRRSIREITDALAKYDVKMINNGQQLINVNGAEVKITFITNTYAESVNPGMLNGLAANNNTKGLKIFLTHQPRPHLIEAAAQHHFDLFLAGHTHGGQITLLFPFYSLSPTLLETRYVKGTFYIGNMMMVVTRGLGMSIVPIRLNSTPEITVININAQ
jgi:predicted MPP superfamily phosphohydrolase